MGKMISILLSCFKSNEEYLTEQINSILNQTEKCFELLVYNDGADCFERIKNKFTDARIKYFDGGHLGYSKAYNYLLKKSSGEYVCLCDQDDVWTKDKLEIEKKYLDEHKKVDCVFGWLNWFGEKEKLESFMISDEQISKDLVFYQPIKNPTVMFRKDRFGEFDCPFDWCADFWFWSKHRTNHFHLIPTVMVNYRRHSGEMTKDKSQFRENHARVIQRNLFGVFKRNIPIDLCKRLDPYSKTYNKDIKEYMEAICELFIA